MEGGCKQTLSTTETDADVATRLVEATDEILRLRKSLNLALGVVRLTANETTDSNNFQETNLPLPRTDDDDEMPTPWWELP